MLHYSMSYYILPFSGGALSESAEPPQLPKLLGGVQLRGVSDGRNKGPNTTFGSTGKIAGHKVM